MQSSGEFWDENSVTKPQSLSAHDHWWSKLACKQAGFFFYEKSLTENHNRVILITVLHTTVMDGGGNNFIECALKEAIQKGYIEGPDYYIAGKQITTNKSK